MAEVDIAAVFQLLGSVASDLRELRKDVTTMRTAVATSEEVASIRQSLTEYHASVLGHGVMISELEDRVRRIERHLNLPPAAAE